MKVPLATLPRTPCNSPWALAGICLDMIPFIAGMMSPEPEPTTIHMYIIQPADESA